MPGFFDFLGGLLGGGDSNPFGDLDFTSAPTGGFGDFGGFDFGGGGFDFTSPTDFGGLLGGFGGDTPIPLQTAPSGLPGLIPGSDPTSNAFTGAPANVGQLLTPNGSYTPSGGNNLTNLPLQQIAQLIAGSGSPAPGSGGIVQLLNPPGPVNGSGGGSGNPLTGAGGSGGGAGGGNPLGGLLTAGGLAGLVGSLFTNNGLGPAADALNAKAKNQEDLVNNQILPTALANQQGYINGQALRSIDQQLQRSEASMRQRYAEMGMSGSTMEAQDLAGLREQAQTQSFNEAQQMAATGLSTAASLSGQDAQIYQQLMQEQVAQDAALQDAMARVAAAFAGGGNSAGSSISSLVSGLLG